MSVWHPDARSSCLSKRWNALSYHRCCEAVASSIVLFEFLPGCENPSDILMKNLPCAKGRVVRHNSPSCLGRN